MKVAMMQPYLFPYIGYFQLVNAVDVFIFADDVNFIKGGRINRNKILFENKERYITVPCFQSQNKLINEIQISTETKGLPETILSTIKHAYSKAPFFKEVFPLLESIFHSEVNNISRLATTSVETVSRYLNIDANFHYSSVSFNHTKGQEKSTRLINITKELGGHTYINPIGGAKLYDKVYFENQGIKLSFLTPEVEPYKQFNNRFIPRLSIIDVMMFNSIKEINIKLNQFQII